MINSLRGDFGRSLLMWVVYNDDAFDHLLNITQDFSVVDEDGQNVFHRIVYSFVDDDVRSRRLMKLSHKTNVDVINRKDSLEQTPLHRVAYYNHHRAIETIIKLGGDVNLKDRWGQTPLHHAARNNSHRTIETIIKLGGDVNHRNNRNQLPDEQDDCDDETRRIIRSSRKWWEIFFEVWNFFIIFFFLKIWFFCEFSFKMNEIWNIIVYRSSFNRKVYRALADEYNLRLKTMFAYKSMEWLHQLLKSRHLFVVLFH